MKIVLETILEGISTRVDGSLKVILSTQELDSAQAGNLLQLRGKYLKVLLSDTNISPAEEQIINEERVKDGRKIKSKAQRLRAVLFAQWEQSGLQIPFDTFYDTEMERFIENIKNKLE